MLLRQVQARPLQGHHLRALRRRGDPPEGAPRAHGPHRPGRPREPHLVLQGRAVADRLPARHRAEGAREGALLRRLDRDLGRQGGARARRARARGQGRAGEGAADARPRGGAGRPRGAHAAAPPVPDRRRGQGLRRGRRVLVADAEQLGRGERHPAARGGPHPGRRTAARGGQADRRRGPEEGARAGARVGCPRRPQARSQGPRQRRRMGRRRAHAARVRARGHRDLEGAREDEGQERHQGPHGMAGRRRRRAQGCRSRVGRDAGRGRPRQRGRAREDAPGRRGHPARADRDRRGHRSRRAARAGQRPVPAHRRAHVQGGREGDRGLGAEGARHLQRHPGPPPRRRRPREGGRRPARPHVDQVQGARGPGGHLRRGPVPRAARPLRQLLGLRRVLRRRHGRGVDPRASAHPRPRRRGHPAARDDPHVEGPEGGARDQAAEGRVGVHQVGQQARVDDPRDDPGDPARAAPDGAARRWPLRHLRPERSLPARDQPQQPPEAAARSRRPRDHRQQREADAAGGRRRAVRQRPPRPRGDGPGQPAAEVAVRHAQGQAGPLPPEPARQARRLLRPLGDRGRPVAAPAPVRAAQADGARALQAVHHEPARRAQARAEHQGRQEDGGHDGARGVGRARGGHRRASGAAQPRADPASPGHPGVRAGAGRGQGDPGAPAGVPRLQRRLRRRPDGGAPAAVGRGPGRGPHPDAVVEQHPLARARKAAGDADAGHGARHLLPDLRGGGSDQGDGGRRARAQAAVLRIAGRGRDGLRPEAAQARRPRSRCASAATGS